jgi:outer membrane receptor protein involved in Fe transport
VQRRVWLAVVCAVALMGRLSETQAQNAIPLPPIHIRDQSFTEAQRLRETSTFATVIDTTEATSRVDSVSDLLSESVGAQVRSFGGLGAFSTVSIRGATPNQVEFYLDNVLLNTANTSLVDAGTVPLDNVERIEIYRGFAPLQLGAGSIGGAINLVTRQVAGETINRASVSYGSFNTQRLTLYRSQGFDNAGYLALFNYTASDGDFTFLDDNGTRFTDSDDMRTSRINNDFRSFSFNTKGKAQLANWKLTLSNDFFTKDQGIPGQSSNQSATARLDVWRNLTTLRAERQTFPFALTDLTLQAAYLWQREHFRDPDGDIGTSIQDDENTSGSLSAQALLNVYLDPWYQTLGVLLEGRYETLQTVDNLPERRGEAAFEGPLQERTNVILALQDEILLFGERLAIRPLLRYQFVANHFGTQPSFRNLPLSLDQETQDHLFSPSLCLQYTLAPFFDLKGNVGRFQRVPTLFELFGDRGTTIGNPRLNPETSLNWDIGFSFELPLQGWLDRLFLEYAYFASDVDDLIVFVQNSQVSARAENIGAAEIRGHELSWSATALHHVRLYGNYTYQDAKDTSDTFSRGNDLPGRPRHEVFQALELFHDWGKFVYEFTYTARNALDRANLFVVNSRELHNLRLTVTPFGPNLKLTFEGKNITDNQVQDVRGFPLPGRSFFGTVEGRF